MTDRATPTEPSAAAPYRVLARKYRPSTFAELIGQEAMVRTLSNAITSGRLAHAFILSGVRGVGKTTTARIIARALNCVGPDGSGGPTIEPCGGCEPCRAISEDRHVDVIEMDAASRTGVDDIRDLTDGVRYRPMSARYKVYIVDEVHMLSKHAFNALLKTLEEPPEHVKFVFATTEIRKVPVTVLSRCQRFDLRRVDAGRLGAHLVEIAEREAVGIEPGAAALIARAADGSVRDGLSILDQAISLGDGGVTEAQLREMLGLADRIQVFDLFDQLMRGDIAAALALMAALYEEGADPVTVLQDLLELSHWLTRVKLVPVAADDPGVPEAERVRGKEMAERLTLPTLTRAWQLLLKGLGEAQMAPRPLPAAEMVLVRLAHAAELPSPAELVRAARDAAPATTPAAPGSAEADRPAPAATPEARGGAGAPGAALAAAAESPPEPATQPAPEASAEPLADPRDFRALVGLFERQQPILHAHLRNNVRLVAFEPGRLELRPERDAPADLAGKMVALLGEWTGRRWVVSLVNEGGAPTLRQEEQERARRELDEAARHPLVQAVREHFPDATIREVRAIDRGPATDPAEEEQP